MANRIGAADCNSGILPEQQLALIKELQSWSEIVTAVGDGINDSPVLAGTNVSIAMGNGTLIAQHSADCIWLGNQPGGMESAFVMARRTMAVVKQNIIWALVYNLTVIPLAAAGLLDPRMAALGISLPFSGPYAVGSLTIWNHPPGGYCWVMIVHRRRWKTGPKRS